MVRAVKEAREEAREEVVREVEARAVKEEARVVVRVKEARAV